MLFSSWYLFWRDPLYLEDENALVFFMPLFPIFLVISQITSRMIAVIAFISKIFTSNDTDNELVDYEAIKKVLDWTPLIAWLIITSIFIYMFLFIFFEWISVIILLLFFWTTFFGIIRWLWKMGLKREHEAQNPLSGILK